MTTTEQVISNLERIVIKRNAALERARKSRYRYRIEYWWHIPSSSVLARVPELGNRTVIVVNNGVGGMVQRAKSLLQEEIDAGLCVRIKRHEVNRPILSYFDIVQALNLWNRQADAQERLAQATAEGNALESWAGENSGTCHLARAGYNAGRIAGEVVA